ncbi:peptidoglycan-binding domain-containing protein [Streptomyces otsuchiensis]|uniref:peptidoglycan-binding domain-containing protein n=1 Tax=Streptomyces otsuchiensis TaxID=2681388 RepID=UPI00102F530D|nr:peptidoglycan-binding protein [Streptomyces otsuchiensis]
MRSTRVTRACVVLTVVVAVNAGLVSAGNASTTVSERQAVPSGESVTPLAVVNLGLTNAEAQKVQRWLMLNWTYLGPDDGLMGPNTWMAMQGALRVGWGYTGARDGIVGPETIKALQCMLKTHHGYTGAIDGIAGAGTQAAFKRFANSR